MKKILVFITLLIIPTIIMAEECSNTELVELKKKASKIEFKLVPDYVYTMSTDPDNGEKFFYKKNIFKIMANNLTDDFYYIRKSDTSDYSEWDSRKISYEDNMYSFLIDHEYNEVYNEYLYIYGNKNCQNKLILKLQLTVPKRNSYYNMGVCEGINDYYLCQEFIYEDYKLSFDHVKKSTEKYRIGKVDENGKKKEDKSFMDMIASFTSKYFVPLIIVLVVAVGIIVYINVKRHNRMKKHFN